MHTSCPVTDADHYLEKPGKNFQNDKTKLGEEIDISAVWIAQKSNLLNFQVVLVGF